MIATFRYIILAALVCAPWALALAQNAQLDAASSYLAEHRQALGLTENDLQSLVVVDQQVNARTGTAFVYLQQQLEGVPVYHAIVNVTVARDGRVLHVGNRAVSDLRGALSSRARVLSAESAVRASAGALGLEVTEPLRSLGTRGELFETVLLSAGGIASEDIAVQLAYVPTERDGVRLSWIVEFYSIDGRHLWHVAIDAATGIELFRDDLVVSDHFAADDYWPAGWPVYTPAGGVLAAGVSIPLAQWAPGAPALVSGSYRVYAAPHESPSHAGDPFQDLRTTVANPHEPTASPLGWHDNGALQFTTTRGNNVHAGVDLVAPNGIDPGGEADGGAALMFDFAFDPSTQAPPAYRPAAVTNLFYWNNIIHDVVYHYGFDEASGNFQADNFGRGGLGNDWVRAEAQDFSGTNNANFSTPADGSLPRMQMYVWTSPFGNELVVGPPVNQTYVMSGAAFGPPFTATGSTGSLVVVNDGTALPAEGCGPLIGFPAGSIAMAYRGTCPFTQKVANAQAAGAIAVVVINNVGGSPITLGGADPSIVIPSGMIAQDDGAAIVASLPVASATARNVGAASLDRDSDFDNGVIVHEYAHGISNRLTGGRTVTNCLNNQEQMGEGWSDYYAVMLTDTNTDLRGIGTYVGFEPTDARGIRPYPYSTQMALNPATYDFTKTAAVPHGVGFVWATMLWDMTRDLVARHGFNPDVYGAWSTGGNNLSIQLVTDGLKIQPCRPGFVDGRDAIMAADAALTGNANQCLIWDAFARRGLGNSALQGLNTSASDGTEAFDLPAYCSTFAMVTDQVVGLRTLGALNRGQANSLLVKLTNAEKRVDSGNPGPALSLLSAFVNQVVDFVATGVLTPDQGQVLIDHAQGLINRIQQDFPEGLIAAGDAGALVSTGLPAEYQLGASSPNPFRTESEIRFELPEATHVRLLVYDVTGREVARLVDAEMEAGYHRVVMDGARLASGIYLYRMEAGSFAATRRMVLAR